MYLGRIVEIGAPDDIVERPPHPYTRALIQPSPSGPRQGSHLRALPIRGEIPSASAVPQGCRFHPRCVFATKECSSLPSPGWSMSDPGHRAACRRWKDI